MKTTRQNAMDKILSHDILGLMSTLPMEQQEHAVRVGNYVRCIWEELCGKKCSEEAGLAARFHDIGKVYIPRKVLNGKSFQDESAIVIWHTHYAAELLRMENAITYGNMQIIPWVQKLMREMATRHHEYWNGSGYPDGIREKEIPIGARMCAVADTYDILRNGLYGYEALEPEDAVYRLQEKADQRLLDPDIVYVFIEKRLYQDEI